MPVKKKTKKTVTTKTANKPRKNDKVQELDEKTRNLFIIFGQTWEALIHAVELELKHAKMNYPQARILYMLTRNERGMTQGQMSRWLARNLNSVSTLINKMVRKGLVKKVTSDDDGKVYVIATRKGIEYWNAFPDRALMLAFSSMTEEEKDQFGSLLKKLRGEVRALLGLDYRPPFLP